MFGNDALTHEQLKTMQLQALLEELSRGTTGSTAGRDRLEVIPPFILVRTAEMVNRQLSGTAETIGRSANCLKDALDHTTETMKTTLENSSAWLINALKVNTEATTKSASEINTRIGTLVSALIDASAELREAGRKSGEAATRLNTFTFVLAVATLLLFVAGCWQAYEVHRQTNILALQMSKDSSQKQLRPETTPQVQVPEPPK